MLSKTKSALGGKRIIMSIALLALVFGMGGVGTAVSKKQNMCPSDIQKVTFVHYAKPANAKAAKVWDDTFDKYKLLINRKEIKWLESMDYQINNETIPEDLDVYDVELVLQDSLDTWNDQISDVQFGLNETSKNSISWADLSEGIIAQNSIWYNLSEGKIIESDVTFNTDYNWSLTGGSEMMDLQNIATHEFGHNGLGDLYNPPSSELTMHGWSSYGETNKRDLGTGDISGIQKLYGSN